MTCRTQSLLTGRWGAHGKKNVIWNESKGQLTSQTSPNLGIPEWGARAVRVHLGPISPCNISRNFVHLPTSNIQSPTHGIRKIGNLILSFRDFKWTRNNYCCTESFEASLTPLNYYYFVVTVVVQTSLDIYGVSASRITKYSEWNMWTLKLFV